MLRTPISRLNFIGAAAAATIAPRVVGAQSLTTLRVASSPNDDVTSLLVAQSRGFFKREGLDVQLQSISSGGAIAAAVAGGSLDIGKSSVMALISAHVRNIPFVIVAPAGIYDSGAPVVSMLVRTDDPMRAPRDLAGKTIAVPALGDLYAVAVNAFVESGGGDPATMRFVEMSSSSSPEAVIKGRVDAVTVTTPVLVRALETGQLRVFAHPFDAISKHFMQAAWFTMRGYADGNRDAIARFNRALRDGALYANAHHSETVPLLAAYTQAEPALIERMPRTLAGVSLEPALLQPVIDAAVRYKAIAAGFDAHALIDPASLTHTGT